MRHHMRATVTAVSVIRSPATVMYLRRESPSSSSLSPAGCNVMFTALFIDDFAGRQYNIHLVPTSIPLISAPLSRIDKHGPAIVFWRGSSFRSTRQAHQGLLTFFTPASHVPASTDLKQTFPNHSTTAHSSASLLATTIQPQVFLNINIYCTNIPRGRPVDGLNNALLTAS